MRTLLRWGGIGAVLLVVAGAGLAVSITAPDLEKDRVDQLLADRTSKWVDIGGTAVHYKEEGSGPALILLHNTGMWHGVWDGWVPILAGDFRVLRPDLPGFGLTGPTASQDYSMQRLAGFIGEFMDAVSLSEAHIAGLSLGGQVAWRFSLDHPERVRSLVLINPTGYPEKSLPAAFKLARSWAGGLIRFVGSPWLLRRNVAGLWGTRAEIPPGWIEDLLTSQRREGNRAAMVRFMRTENPSRHAEVGSLQVPVQIQWSQKCGPQRFSEDLPGAEMILYDDLGHFPNVEAPQESADHALRFLLRQSR